LISTITTLLSHEIEINTLSINKLKNETADFEKYDIDVALDEVGNNEGSIKLKYKFTLLSNPTNIKISLDGFVSIHGNETEISKHLQPDQKNVPAIVNGIYQEIFPLVYLITKTMRIPSPAYRLSEISSMPRLETESAQPQEEIAKSSTNSKSEPVEEAGLENEPKISEEPALEEPVIEQANVSSR
jgi:hypothetical protein